MSVSEPVELNPRFHANPILNSIIAKVLCIPEVNRRIRAYHQIVSESIEQKDKVAYFLELTLAELQTNWELNDAVGLFQNLARQESPILFIANHPLGGRDGLVLLDCLASFWDIKQVKALVNEFLLSLPYLGQLFLPVSPSNMKGGGNIVQQLRLLHDTLERGQGESKALLLFPAGLCSRWHKKESLQWWAELPQNVQQNGFTKILTDWQPLQQIYDLPWRPSFLHLARKHHLPILPLHISGHNSRVFYSVARLRKKLGLRFSWEMLLLPREFLHNHFAQKSKCQLTITPGAVLEAKQILQWPSKQDHVWAQLCKHYIYQLPRWNNAERAQQNLDELHRAIVDSLSI